MCAYRIRNVMLIMCRCFGSSVMKYWIQPENMSLCSWVNKRGMCHSLPCLPLRLIIGWRAVVAVVAAAWRRPRRMVLLIWCLCIVFKCDLNRHHYCVLCTCTHQMRGHPVIMASSYPRRCLIRLPGIVSVTKSILCIGLLSIELNYVQNHGHSGAIGMFSHVPVMSKSRPTLHIMSEWM